MQKPVRTEKENRNPQQQPSTSKGMVRPSTSAASQASNVRASRSKAAALMDASSDESPPHSPQRAVSNRSPQRPPLRSPQRANNRSPPRAATRTQQEIQPPSKPVGALKRKKCLPVQLEINRLREQTNPTLIPRAPFCRLIRENLQRNQRGNDGYRITPTAIECLRESTELYLTNMLSDAYRITLNRKQVTLQPKDVQLLMLLRETAHL